MKLHLKFWSKSVDTSRLVEGISSGFILKHLPTVILVVIASLSYISVRFDCMTAMQQTANIRVQLEVARADVQRERAKYMSATCESNMQQMVDSLHLNLHIQERPPFKISY